MSDNFKLYRQYFDHFQEVNGNKFQKTEYPKEVGARWKTFKNDGDNFPENVKQEIRNLREILDQKKLKHSKFWNKVSKQKPVATEPSSSTETAGQANVPSTSNAGNEADVSFIPVNQQQHRAPAQELLEKDITNMLRDVNYLQDKKLSGFATDAEIKTLTIKRDDLKRAQAKLLHLQQNQKRQKKKRDRERQILEDNPELASTLKRRKKHGHPSIETDHPQLHQIIVDIALKQSGADERRRTDILRSAKTLDDLHDEVKGLGVNLSRSALYLRLLPKRSSTFEGRKHVNTVPVKLIRASNDAHKQHADTKFCRTTISFLEEIAVILGNQQVLFISQDDKARVPLGITAASKQAPILMHMDYRIKLPDHDWVVADKHKLIPSVYALVQIKQTTKFSGSVGYSGPTFIAIRSGKHCSSTAYSHARDFDTILNQNDFFDYARDSDGKVKPVVMITVDGGPDENPRYEKVIDCAIRHFRTYDLDAMFVATNAPGRSAYNRVERRMAPLSHELAGVILPYDSYGSHLDEQRKTVDFDLEKQNFEKAGGVLVDIWNNLTIDKYNTTAVYVKPEDSELSDVGKMDALWKGTHVRESHYFLQIVKCTNSDCCLPPRGNYFKLFPRFVPAPLYLNKETMTPGITSDNESEFCNFLLRLRLNDSGLSNQSGEVPFDIACPSVAELIAARVCKFCGLYFASIKNLKEHLKICSKKPSNNPTLDLNTQLLSSRSNNRPVRIAAQRGREKMVIWTSRINDQHCDWMEPDDLINIEAQESANIQNEEVFPVVDAQFSLKNIWEEDNND